MSVDSAHLICRHVEGTESSVTIHLARTQRAPRQSSQTSTVKQWPLISLSTETCILSQSYCMEIFLKETTLLLCLMSLFLMNRNYLQHRDTFQNYPKNPQLVNLLLFSSLLPSFLHPPSLSPFLFLLSFSLPPSLSFFFSFFLSLFLSSNNGYKQASLTKRRFKISSC